MSSTVPEEEEEDEEAITILTSAVVVIGAEQAAIQRAECRKPTRRYLCRPELLPDPRRDTPWQVLYDSRNGRAYITTMGINVATFDYILHHGFAAQWNENAIPCSDTNSSGNPRSWTPFTHSRGGSRACISFPHICYARHRSTTHFCPCSCNSRPLPLVCPHHSTRRVA